MTNYKVNMTLRVLEYPSLLELLPQFNTDLEVQVPAYTIDDEVSLVMHLEHCAKLKVLYQLRKTVAEGKEVADLPYGALLNKQFIVRGQLLSYKPV